jgi:hypothetical protein
LAALILLVFSIRERPMETETLSTKPRLRLLLDHLAVIKDTRQPWKVAYPLREVLFLVVCGTIASGDDYDDIVDWGRLTCCSCGVSVSFTTASRAPIGCGRS